MGKWIEICMIPLSQTLNLSLPLVGKWIEILLVGHVQDSAAESSPGGEVD